MRGLINRCQSSGRRCTGTGSREPHEDRRIKAEQPTTQREHGQREDAKEADPPHAPVVGAAWLVVPGHALGLPPLLVLGGVVTGGGPLQFILGRGKGGGGHGEGILLPRSRSTHLVLHAVEDTQCR